MTNLVGCFLGYIREASNNTSLVETRMTYQQATGMLVFAPRHQPARVKRQNTYVVHKYRARKGVYAKIVLATVQQGR